MSTEDNKAVVRRFWEEVWNNRNPEVAGELVAPEELPNVMQFYGVFLTACPDLRVTVEDMVAEGDRVADRITFSGTHTGALNLPGLSLAATGRTASTRMVEIWQVVNGKMVDHWGEWDRVGLMQQLGAVGAAPRPAQTS